MGCDIHVYVEVKIEGSWYNYGTPYVSRNYTLFAKMADVRNYDSIIPIDTPRGLPTDISKVVEAARRKVGVDGHSDSWLSYDEFVELREWFKEQTGHDFWDENFDLFEMSLYTWRKYREYYPEQVEDVRFVFWFDN